MSAVDCLASPPFSGILQSLIATWVIRSSYFDPVMRSSMLLTSSLELPSSPREQASWSAQTWHWDATNEILAGEVLSAPTCFVYKFSPPFPENVEDVTADVVAMGYPAIGGVGPYLNMVNVKLMAGLLPGFSYRVQLSATGSLGSTPARFFVVKCNV